MHLDMTVTLGNVIQTAVIVSGLFLAYTRLRERLVRIETRLGPLWREYTGRRGYIRRGEDRE